MTEIICTIIVIIINVGYNFIRKNISKKRTKLRFTGVEELTVRLIEKKYEKNQELKRLVKEISDIIFSELSNVYKDGLKITEDELKSIALDQFIDKNRRKLDFLMDEVIENNHIAERSDLSFEQYKKDKCDYIFEILIKESELLYKENIFIVPYNKLKSKIKYKLYEVCIKHLYHLFDQLKLSSVCYKEEIVNLTVLREELKNLK